MAPSATHWLRVLAVTASHSQASALFTGSRVFSGYTTAYRVCAFAGNALVPQVAQTTLRLRALSVRAPYGQPPERLKDSVFPLEGSVMSIHLNYSSPVYLVEIPKSCRSLNYPLALCIF